jgi:hypothetical protein
MIITSVTLLTGFSSLGLLVLVAGYGTSGFLCSASHLPVGLLRLLQGLAHRLFDPEILDRLVEQLLYQRAGVRYLLYLRLLIRDLLGYALQLGAIALRLALDPAQWLPIEVLGTLYGLLLDLLGYRSASRSFLLLSRLLPLPCSCCAP